MNAGDVIAGKYRLEACLGQGAIGEVWRAQHLGLDTPVAIKLLHAAIARDPDARVRLSREARIAATLKHPGAVAVLDAGETDGIPYLVMELLVGLPLRGRLDDPRPLAVSEALDIAHQIAVVLEAAHALHLVHRDIKPENVFLEEDDGGHPRVRVVDFGLAFIAPPGAATHGLGRLTIDGTVSGTPAYMAPEQIRGEAIGPACDVYALGCVLYEMLTGDPPFVGNVAQVFTRHVYVPPVPIAKAAADRDLPAGLDELIQRMLGKSPLVRPPLAEIVARLDPAAISPGTPAPHGEGARADRMVAAPSAPPPGVVERELHWVGDEDAELMLALAANAIAVRRDAPNAGAVVYAPGASLDELRRLAAAHAFVITDFDGRDMRALIDRLRAGAGDLVSRPVRAEDLVTKLRRAPT